MMKGTVELYFERPVKEDISRKGEFGAPRHYGPHKGVDFKSPLGTPVKASESGKVVFSSERPGSKEKTKYGHVIVIDHTPEAGDYQRHMYTLYAHLDSREAYVENKVEKDKIIGRSGNSGTKESYSGADKAKQHGYHLHFELIDSPRKLLWNGENWHENSLRKNPMVDYFSGKTVIEYH
jgi:murein DD-endopeptidase MepM/ murein hydrolase activator NlpD